MERALIALAIAVIVQSMMVIGLIIAELWRGNE